MGWRDDQKKAQMRRHARLRNELERQASLGVSVSQMGRMRQRMEDVGVAFEPIIEGLIREGESILFGGTSEVGKSMLLRQMAAAVATSEDFLGWRVPQSRRVVYFAVEDDLLSVMGEVERDQVAAPSLVFVPRGEFHLRRKEGLRNMKTVVKKHRPDLVIIDTVAVVTGEGNRESDVVEAFAGLDQLRKAAGNPAMSFVLVRHTKKPPFGADPTGKKARDAIQKDPKRFQFEIAGSHQWPAKARGTLGLVQLRDEDDAPEPNKFLLMGIGNDFAMFNDRFLTRTVKAPFRYSLTDPRRAFNLILEPSLKKIFRVMCDAGSFTYSKMEKRGYNRKMVSDVIRKSKPFGVIRKVGDLWEVAEAVKVK